MEYVSLQLKRKEALECLRALMLQALLEEELALQKGVESPSTHPVLIRLIDAFGIEEDQFDRAMEGVAEEMWEYSWYVFTNEWAWFRAQQEALRTGTAEMRVEDPKTQKKAELLYKEKFEKFVSELNMRSFGSRSGDRRADGKRKNTGRSLDRGAQKKL